MKQETVQKILQETEQGYDLMAEKFSQTRKHFWRGLEFIGRYAQSGSNVLDFGCGNGRLLELLSGAAEMQYYGTDVSQRLLDLAQQRYQRPNVHFSKTSGQITLPSTNFNGHIKDRENRNFVQGENIKENKNKNLVLGLPLADNFFNTAYSIAVFHHLPSKEYRADSARELHRTVKSGGYVVITVWNLWQKKYLKNILQNWWKKITLRGDLDWNDCRISFADNEGKQFQRFHHAFTKRELEELFSAAGFSIESCEVVGGRNIVLVGKKP
jgi:tRNA (uracil-5-)-methyltransferase TRM9